jgi:hypothetical protein
MPSKRKIKKLRKEVLSAICPKCRKRWMAVKPETGVFGVFSIIWLIRKKPYRVQKPEKNLQPKITFRKKCQNL